MFLNILIIYGSTREKRVGINFAKYISNEVKDRKHNSYYLRMKGGSMISNIKDLAKELLKKDR